MSRQIPQSKDEELALGLERARNRWMNRTYSNNVSGTQMNQIKNANIMQISQILFTYKTSHELSEDDKRMAKLLIDNSNLK